MRWTSIFILEKKNLMCPSTLSFQNVLYQKHDNIHWRPPLAKFEYTQSQTLVFLSNTSYRALLFTKSYYCFRATKDPVQQIPLCKGHQYSKHNEFGDMSKATCRSR